jgi:hypothetical protein
MAAAKVLFVSSAIQQVLMEQVYKHEFKLGFWAEERPAGHGDVWQDVEIKVAEEDGALGPVGFKAPRNYNFMNLDFFDGAGPDGAPMKNHLVKIAQQVKPNATEKHVKAELVELGQIVGGRLTNRSSTAVKVNRGNHKPGTVVASSRQAREQGKSLAEVAAATANTSRVIVAPKKTVVKAKPAGEEQVEGSNTEHVDAGHSSAANADDKQQAA